MIPGRAWDMLVKVPSQDPMIPAAFEGSKNHGILWNLALRSTLALFTPGILRGPNPDVYVKGRDEFRASQRPKTSQNHESVLDVGSAPATNMRQNQFQVNDRTHTTNTPRTPHVVVLDLAPGKLPTWSFLDFARSR